MRIARILITPELVRELLHLPLATEIVGSRECHGQVELVVRYPDLADVPCADGWRIPGERLPLVQPTFQRQEPVVFLDWGQ